MNKLLSALLAGAVALALSTAVAAADEAQSPTQNQETHPGSNQEPGSDPGLVTSDPNQGGAEVSAKEQAYLASLKKCEPLSGDQRQQCIDAARRQSGEM